MPTIRRAIDHELGRAEAKRRLERFLDNAAKTTHLQHEWQDDALSFAASVQGIKISGKALVLPAALQLEVRLPLIAMPFANWITRIMKIAISGQLPEPVPAGQKAQPQPAAPMKAVMLFLHIPKAAGTTLSEYIFAQCRSGVPSTDDPQTEGLYREGVYYAPFGFFKTEGIEAPEYARAVLRDEHLRAVIGHFSYGIHEHMSRPYRYFTMLRHPVDRVLSLYYFLKADEDLPLARFLDEKHYSELDNDQTRRIAGVDPPFGGVTAAHFEQARANLRENFILAGLSERFDESVLLLKEALGWTEDFIYYPRNVTVGRPGRESLSGEVRQRILDLNSWDVKLYQEAEGLLDEKITGSGRSFATALAAYQKKLPAQ